MAEAVSTSQPAIEDIAASYVRSRPWPYRRWMASVGIPIHKGYFIDDLTKLELGWWEERGCNAAFLELAGSEGISETRLTEIPPGATLPPLKFALDEVVYVVQGRGFSSIWGSDGSSKKSFEWQKNSMFLVPRGHTHQLSNAQGDQPVRLLHYNCLPLVMATLADPEFYFNNARDEQDRLGESNGEFYTPAIAAQISDATLAFGVRDIWFGNFFPDMRAWDKLAAHTMRGVGASAVYVQFPGSEMAAHMSVFPARTYKKAHRHGPAFVIVIPAGDGYSIMWEEGKEKMVFPWKGGQPVRAPQPLVPPALQRRRDVRPLPGVPPAGPVRGLGGADPGPPARPDRVPRRGPVRPPDVRGGARQARPHHPHARASLHRPRLPAPRRELGGSGRGGSHTSTEVCHRRHSYATASCTLWRTIRTVLF